YGSGKIAPRDGISCQPVLDLAVAANVRHYSCKLSLSFRQYAARERESDDVPLSDPFVELDRFINGQVYGHYRKQVDFASSPDRPRSVRRLLDFCFTSLFEHCMGVRVGMGIKRHDDRAAVARW